MQKASAKTGFPTNLGKHVYPMPCHSALTYTTDYYNTQQKQTNTCINAQKT